MIQGPWYISSHAVHKYISLAAPKLSFHEARHRLVELTSRTWGAYLTKDMEPKISKTGAYLYRNQGPDKIRFVVSMAVRPEGPKPQVVDVIPASMGETHTTPHFVSTHWPE